MEDTQHVQEPTGYAKLTEQPADDAQESMSPWRLKREVLITLVFVLMVLMSGGLILGFGPVYSKLVNEGQWSEKCPDGGRTEESCPQQEVYLQYVYSTSFLCLSAANAFFGIFLDVAGPRANVVIGMLIAIIGNLLMAYGESTSNGGISIIAGYSMIGAGGFAAFIASFQMVQLFENQEIFCSLLSGAFNASGYVYMLLMIQGVTRRHFYLGYSVFAAVCLVIFFVMYPLRAITQPSSHLTLSGFSCRMAKLAKPQGLWSGLKPELRRKDLWLFAFFFAWGSTLIGFAGGAIPNIISKNANGNKSTTDLYTNVLFPVIVNGTFIYTPFIGHIINRYGFRVTIFINLVVFHLFICSLLAPSLSMQVVSLILMAIAQGIFYALQFSYIMMCFPNQVYGSLQSFLAISSFLMGLLNYVFTPWTQNQLDGNYTTVLLIFAAPLVPLYLCLSIFKKGHDDDVADIKSERASVRSEVVASSSDRV